MADYDLNIPNGIMRIRDTGGWVEFWFKTGSSTWNNDQTWGYQANGAYSQQDFRLVTGGNWQKFGAVYVTERQNVMFRIIGEGLGWPTTDHSVFIERANVPSPPDAPYLVDRSTDRIRVAFNPKYDGGLIIDAFELWHSWNRTPRTVVAGRDVWVTGLSPKTPYFFWGKAHNAKGWSELSPMSEIMTLGVPHAPLPVDLFNVQQTSLVYSFTPAWDGGSPLLEVQLGYGLDPVAPTIFVSNNPKAELFGLQPGRTYYFWARTRNALGWSPWSARSTSRLNAGAWVNDAGIWKRALPWVKQGGVWKIARPNIPVSGTWRVPRS